LAHALHEVTRLRKDDQYIFSLESPEELFKKQEEREKQRTAEAKAKELHRARDKGEDWIGGEEIEEENEEEEESKKKKKKNRE
jgi:hypothetical protein